MSFKMPLRLPAPGGTTALSWPLLVRSRSQGGTGEGGRVYVGEEGVEGAGEGLKEGALCSYAVEGG